MTFNQLKRQRDREEDFAEDVPALTSPILVHTSHYVSLRRIGRLLYEIVTCFVSPAEVAKKQVTMAKWLNTCPSLQRAFIDADPETGHDADRYQRSYPTDSAYSSTYNQGFSGSGSFYGSGYSGSSYYEDRYGSGSYYGNGYGSGSYGNSYGSGSYYGNSYSGSSSYGSTSSYSSHAAADSVYNDVLSGSARDDDTWAGMTGRTVATGGGDGASNKRCGSLRWWRSGWLPSLRWEGHRAHRRVRSSASTVAI